MLALHTIQFAHFHVCCLPFPPLACKAHAVVRSVIRTLALLLDSSHTPTLVGEEGSLSKLAQLSKSTASILCTQLPQPVCLHSGHNNSLSLLRGDHTSSDAHFPCLHHRQHESQTPPQHLLLLATCTVVGFNLKL